MMYSEGQLGRKHLREATEMSTADSSELFNFQNLCLEFIIYAECTSFIFTS